MHYSIEGTIDAAEVQDLLNDVERILDEFGDARAGRDQPSDYRIVVRTDENVDLGMMPTVWLSASSEGASVTYRMKHLGLGTFAPEFRVDGPWARAREGSNLGAVRDKLRQFRQILTAGDSVEPAAVLSSMLLDALGQLLAERDELLQLLLDLRDEHAVALERIDALEGQLATLRLAEAGQSGPKNILRKAVATAVLALLPVAGVVQAARISRDGSAEAARQAAIATVESSLISRSQTPPASQEVANVRALATQLVGECPD